MDNTDIKMKVLDKLRDNYPGVITSGDLQTATLAMQYYEEFLDAEKEVPPKVEE